MPSFYKIVKHENNFFWIERPIKGGKASVILYEMPLNSIPTNEEERAKAEAEGTAPTGGQRAQPVRKNRQKKGAGRPSGAEGRSGSRPDDGDGAKMGGAGDANDSDNATTGGGGSSRRPGGLTDEEIARRRYERRARERKRAAARRKAQNKKRRG